MGVSAFTPSEIVLELGDKIAADLVVLATGWRTDYAFLASPVRARLLRSKLTAFTIPAYPASGVAKACLHRQCLDYFQCPDL